MAIIINIDVVLAKRKMSVTELSEKVGITMANISVLKNGKELGLTHLEYAYQDNPKGGIADALALAEDFADEEPLTVILGDNTTDADITSSLASFEKGAMIFLKKVPDPHRFGVPEFDKDNPQKISKIIEKPKIPPTDFAVIGLYVYDKQVFKYIRQCDPSSAGRGELEITEVNNFYIKAGEMSWAEIDGYWWDAGTFETLLAASNHWAKKASK